MSRYDFFTETSEGYPDVYSMDNSIFSKLDEETPLFYQLTKPEADRFDILMLQIYNTTEYMWIVLWFNGLATIFELSEGMYLKFPSMKYLSSFQENSWRR